MKAETQLLVRLDPKLHKALQKIRQKTNVTVSDQVRQAIALWVEASRAPKEGSAS